MLELEFSWVFRFVKDGNSDKSNAERKQIKEYLIFRNSTDNFEF